MRHPYVPTIIAFGALLCAPAANADTLRATRNQPLTEIAHAVKLTLKDGVAHYRVRRSFANRGKLHEEAVLGIVLPYGAAVVGLRIRGKDRWHDGELMEAEKARLLYRKLTGLGPHEPRDPALLRWRWANEAELFLFPILPGRTSTVEYTLIAPTRYQRGRYHASYQGGVRDPKLATPILDVHPASKGALIKVDGRLAAAGQPVVLPRPTPPPTRATQSSPSSKPVLPKAATVGLKALESGASHVVSKLVVTRRGDVGALEVAVDLRHTYRGDLRVALVTPKRKRHVLHDRTGGGKNHVRKTFKVRLKKRLATRGTWRLHVSDHAGRDVGSLESWSLKLPLTAKRKIEETAKDTPLFVPDAPTHSSGGGRSTTGQRSIPVQIVPPPINVVAARYGRAVAGPKKEFARLEVDVAPRLQELPRKAQVVFVVDASRSVEAKGLRAQLAIARGYLSHVPDAEAEVVLYRRRASRLFERFLPAKDAIAAMAKAATGALGKKAKTFVARRLGLGNGSSLDAGAKLAVEELAKRPGSPAVKRVVLLGDALLRPRWHNKDALQALSKLPRAAIVHVVLPGAGETNSTPSEKRDDKHALASLAARHGGVLLSYSDVPTGAKLHPAMKRAALGLVRPVRIDHFAVSPKGLPFMRRKVLAEGNGVRELLGVKQAPRAVVLTGKIWARSFRRRVVAKQAFSRATAAFVFALDRHGSLSRKEMLRLARFGRAVSPVTSYLAIEPGVRPSTAGLDRMGNGSGSLGGRYGRGYGSLSGSRYAPNLSALVAPVVARCKKRHRAGADWSFSVRVETTYDEIVDVRTVGKLIARERCVVEGLWGLEASRTRLWKQRDAFALQLR